MKSKTIRHLSHYVVLLILLSAGLIALTLVDKNTLIHTLILILIAVSYFVWGVIHQFLEKEINSEIILEYFLLSLLGLALVLGVLYYL